jgi:malate dehydrogenase (oxaloacetate-decarboxylating)
MSDEPSHELAPRLQPSASYSFTMRLHMPQHGGAFARIARAIADAEAIVGAIDLVRVESREVVRDITVACVDSAHAEAVVRAVRDLEGVRVDSVSDRTFLMHKGGKIEVNPKLPIKTRDDLSMAYTPGVGRVSMAIHEDPAKAWALTIKSNTVAIISDGTAVLGLGDIGPEAAMPVMEGKATLFKEFAGVDAFPLCLDTKDVDQIVSFVKAAAPTFGGVNLEDISAPRCFELERRLRSELDIPVFHDDQHGTAIVVLAALLNALRVVGKRLEDITIVVVGAGAASLACADIMLAQGVGDVIACNRRGGLYAGAEHLDADRAALAQRTNKHGLRGTADEVLQGADVLVGVSGPGAVSAAAVRRMAPGAIVFAMANPVPEIHPERSVRTSRSSPPGALTTPTRSTSARVPRRLQGRARGARTHDQRGDEARRRARHRPRHPPGRAARRLHHSQRLQSPRRRIGSAGGRRRRSHHRCGSTRAGRPLPRAGNRARRATLNTGTGPPPIWWTRFDLSEWTVGGGSDGR